MNSPRSMTPPSERSLVSTKEAADLLALTPVRVIQLITTGRLPAVTKLPGGSYLLDRAVVERLATERIEQRAAALERLRTARVNWTRAATLS